MATTPVSIARVTDGGVTNVYTITWEGVGNADVGAPAAMAGGSDRSVTMTGTFGSATVVLQGSNDGTNWFTLTDPQGSAISKTSAAMEGIVELTRFIRPSSSGGTGTDVDVIVLVKGQF